VLELLLLQALEELPGVGVAAVALGKNGVEDGRQLLNPLGLLEDLVGGGQGWDSYPGAPAGARPARK